jgi:hypothetical protein
MTFNLDLRQRKKVKIGRERFDGAAYACACWKRAWHRWLSSGFLPGQSTEVQKLI